MYKYIAEDGARLCSAVPSTRVKNNGRKIKHKEFQLNVRKNFCMWRVAKL